ncbi:unnamed protein product [Dicrocoelium dendriticum]|nr:unnamed protein product [Dicrocoelium dendriticum]
MPKYRKKVVPPPLAFLYPPFSKPLGKALFISSSDLHPDVRTAPADDKCDWIDPDFKLSGRPLLTHRKRSVKNSHPSRSAPALEFVVSDESSSKEVSCPRNLHELLVKETPESRK